MSIKTGTILKRRNFVGQKFNRLLIVADAPDRKADPNKKGVRYAVCLCECGNTVTKQLHMVTSGKTRSCGCLLAEVNRTIRRKRPAVSSATLGMIGNRYNRLTVLSVSEIIKDNNRQVTCRCECGAIVEKSPAAVRNGKVLSCGCAATDSARQNIALVPKKAVAHGHSVRGKLSRTYQSWSCMKTRCTNPNYRKWAYYGGRGITICERWFSFENFLSDMGERPEKTTLDRIDPDGNYEPSNCRWADAKTQSLNTRRSAKTVIIR